ncbi:hypothetical protein NLJ89_g12390 [Agrocybe chaxingu]|uniref:Uncharacterized protein n=1 Tax=Agrocybe chaxingu TaxID=84603 RepID=A0A9W8JN76_9AGAR|nr:hypothetical protein NLJ89_g12390 [Agrocybe chaxingu]
MSCPSTWSTDLISLHNKLNGKVDTLNSILGKPDCEMIELLLNLAADVAAQLMSHIEAEKLPAMDRPVHEPLFRLRKSFEVHKEKHHKDYKLPAHYSQLKRFLQIIMEERNPARLSDKGKGSKVTKVLNTDPM